MTVTALLVCHDGVRWLPAVLDGLERQTRPPDRLLAIDTGSTDGTPELLRERLGADAVLSVPAGSFPSAVAAGLTALAASDPLSEAGPGQVEWLWLLHDDSAPAPDALAHLLSAARTHPTVSVLGPKIREWPSLRRLVEVGVTLSGTGRRETGLERGEYDQGQHDRPREVLAVNTAGMLVRRDTIEAVGGFDERLPVFGNDLDFGWRAARAGHRTLVVPDAVLFHAEAARRGVRRTPLTGTSPRRAERRAALYTLLVNCSALALPLVALRLLLGTILRAVGLLLVRAPKEAFDEVAALVLTYLRPDRILVGRSRRRRSATVPPREVRHLLAPPWLPYRHGLDVLGDLAGVLTYHAKAASSHIRLAGGPTVGVFLVLVVLAFVGARGLAGSGVLSGGALLPPPDSAGDWWRLYLSSWHPVGMGSDLPAGPYVLPLAVAGSLLLGNAWLLLDVLFLLAVPLAAFGGYRFLVTLTGARAAALWGAVAYGLLPVVSGAVAQGRLGTVVAALVLPWLAHSALFLGLGTAPDRRWRAAWRTSLWLALLSAFVPLAWPLAVVASVVAVMVGVTVGGRAAREPGGWGPVLVPAAVTPLLLLPWSATTFAHRGLTSLLTEAGLAAPALLDGLGPWDALLGRPAEVGAAPAWIGVGVVAAAVLALLRADTRPAVVVAWSFAVLGLGATAVLADRRFDVPASTEPALLWLGFPVLLAQAALVCAAAVAGAGIGRRLAGSSFGWQQPVGLVVVVAAVAAPVAGAFWWAATGTPGPLDRRAATALPTYMTDAARAHDVHGVLVVSGDRRAGFEYGVHRDDGLRTGDETVVPPAATQRRLTQVVTNLATAPTAEDIDALSRHGIEFIYTTPPTDVVFAGNLDSASGVSPASALRPGARAWQVDAAPSAGALGERPASPLRPWLLGIQALALCVVGVLAAPTRRVTR